MHDQVATKADISLLQKGLESLENRLLLKIPAIVFIPFGLLKYIGLDVSSSVYFTSTNICV